MADENNQNQSQQDNSGQGAPVPPQGGGQPGGATPPPPAGGQQGGAPMPPPAGGQTGAPVPPPAAHPPQGAPMPPGAHPPQGAPMPPGAFPPQGAPMPPGGFPPAGGAPMPPGGFPPAGQAPMPPGGYPPGATPPPPAPEDTTPANFQLGTKLPAKLNVPVPAHELKFDQDYFIKLLAGSISLSKDEKKKIIESIPKLKQAQIDELIRIFEEEKQKFAALSKKHVPQLEKLADQHYNDWMDLEADYQQNAKKEEDTSKADDIRKQLGI